jgi:adenosylmethionine---8-amino-7-oxononanoate aminotransferase
MTKISNLDLLHRSHAAVWHPCTQMKWHETLPLIPIQRGDGAWLVDFNGVRYLDAVSSWWVNLFGHCNPRINAAIIEQLGQLEHVMLAGFTHEPVVKLSERLAKLAPVGLGHCFYASDGASAVEIALKMSTHYWRNCGLPDKTNFISLQNSYHGETLGALSVTDVALFKDAYGALLKHYATVPSPDSRLAEVGESSYDYALRCAVQLEDYLQQHHKNIAAFIIEPLVQGAAGMAMYHPVYLTRARALCDQFNVHLIADEIAVGMGRTGTMFACEQAPIGIGQTNGITPDLLCLSKGITGGYLPLSVVMTHNQIYQAFYEDDIARGFLHSHSYTGNPLACRAALATLDIFEQDNVLVTNQIKATYLNRIAQPLRTYPHVKHFRHIGMIWAFEVEHTQPNFAQRCFALALEQQLLLRPIGNTLYFIPPYIISEAEMDELITRILIVIDRLTNL